MTETFARDLGMRVHKLSCLMGRAAERQLQTLGKLTFAQFRILVALLHGASLSQRTIAEYHGVTEAAVSRMLATLERQKLVTLAHEPGNRRTHQLTLTPRGKRLAARAAHLLESRFSNRFHHVSVAGRRTLLSTLDTLITGLST